MPHCSVSNCKGDCNKERGLYATAGCKTSTAKNSSFARQLPVHATLNALVFTLPKIFYHIFAINAIENFKLIQFF